MSDNLHHLDEASEKFPPVLREINQPVKELYVRGNVDLLHEEAMLAVVGSRKASHYGKNALHKILPPLIEAGVPIVSGLAYGIDSIAHKLCVEAGKPTIAVLGSGIDDESVYPKRHIKLVHEILETGGAVVSEYALKTPPYLGQFPARNRIVAGLAKVTLVAQAAHKSGSLITARLALENGRDVAAIPGAINDELAWGTNFLIKNGAAPITEAQDLLDMFGFEETAIGPEKQLSLTEEQNKIYSRLSGEPAHIDDLVEATGMPASLVAAELIQMEIVDAVQNTGGMKFVKK